MKKKLRKNKYLNINQKSFHFEDYLETSKNKKKLKNSDISHDRIYLLFFLFFSLITIFAFKITFVSLKDPKNFYNKNNLSQFITLRRDIVDRNGILISRNVQSYHAAVNPKLIKNKKNFLIKIRLNFPDLPLNSIEKKLNKGKYFYLKKRLDQKDKEKLWSLGEKGVIFEPFQSRIYTHANLFSHILGQVDYDNYGISGVEKFFDQKLKEKEKLNTPLMLSLDTNIQHIVDDELNKAMNIFKATGGGALLMDAISGQVISLVSLPNFNINKRESIKDKNYINKITKGVYELGSIFKTFTVALAIDKELVSPETIIKNIPRRIKCSVHEISDIKQFPDRLSVQDILIRSSNIGTLMLARKIGEQNYKDFIDKTNLSNTPDFEIGELGTPLKIEWNKCKLETISYGHGIAVTPLQAATTYAMISNGGNFITPTLLFQKEKREFKQIISPQNSDKLNNILRKVVTEKDGTASLADIYGYDVGGKT